MVRPANTSTKARPTPVRCDNRTGQRGFTRAWEALFDRSDGMNNLIFDKQLRSFCIRTFARRRAFTLAELIVSMGILLLMLTLAGQVMSLTVQATGQAKALTDVNRALRIFEQALREDLRFVQPGNSVMVIQGNPINAYWTQTGKEADADGNPANGYPHVRDPERECGGCSGNMARPRADILTFFTVRRSRNYVTYEYDGVLGQAVTSGVQQVVYGHANLIEYPTDGTDFDAESETVAEFPSDPAVYWPVPAEQWHLARREVHLLDLNTPPPDSTPKWCDAARGNCVPDDGFPDNDVLGNPAFLLGETDVMTGFDYHWWVIEALTPDEYPVVGGWPYYWPPVLGWVRPGFPPPFARSFLDPTPPPRFADRLGHYFLPNCASFKVEWALDPDSPLVDGRLDNEKEMYWFDPGADDPLEDMERLTGDPAYQYLDDLLGLKLGGDVLVPPGGIVPPGGDGQYSLRDRFGGRQLHPDWHDHDFGDGTRPNLAVFAATRREAAPPGSYGDLIPEDVFPAALRITVDLFDDDRRLERPVRHVIVVPVGG